ncbi:MAG: hypothetical protein ACTTJ3_07880, partial [Treponema sp.]
MTSIKRFILGVICGVLLACFVIGGLFLIFGRGSRNNQSVLDSNLISLSDGRKGNGTYGGSIGDQYDEEQFDGNDSLHIEENDVVSHDGNFSDETLDGKASTSNSKKRN